ncbi:Major Facilitator Superfamily protein [Geodermatophilus telluris]|uniref:Major Facilitator Superfamily protein n=1 Tax=Geodermatophilus telluris TaxID=1190417 RepID=A0A1G6T812_9ACTN|nr:MFS transporter [Geodermatophilus telluris]SDD25143.1 Major Facilitator Superfamily protein [Geodermatophilus telluris]
MTATAVRPNEAPPPREVSGLRRLWDRKLHHYPENGPRSLYLGITVLATVILYYELYVGGAVATQIIAELGFSFTGYVFVSVIGNLVGAFASLFAGLADRWGRANLVVGGLLLTGLLLLVGLPHAPGKTAFTVLFAVLSFVEGVVLVATPALIRDFSPQVGRGVAMGFWTLGPVLGSLVVTTVSSNTLDEHPDWRWQFYVCGTAGLVVFVVALVGLRELSPALRDQLMVSMRDRALVEARARGLDTEQALKGHWRQVLRFDVVGSAFAISIFLLLYYILVGFAVVYFATVFGYSEQRANALANWYWVTNAIALVVTGVLTDRFRVRKPFMVVGTLVGLVGSVLFALSATRPETGYYTIATYFILSAAGGGMAYVAWMASFTETVERHNPAATATGLAVWGWLLRLVVTASLAVFTLVVPATSVLVDQGSRVSEIVAAHPQEVAVLSALDPATSAALAADPQDVGALATALGAVATQQGADADEAAAVSEAVRTRAPQLAAAQAVDPATLAALQADPTDPAAGAAAVGQIASALGVDAGQATQLLVSLGDPAVQADLALVQRYGTVLQQANTSIPADDLAYLAEHGDEVAAAAEENPRQWQRWWWVCVAGQLLFLPFVFVMAGRWSPRRARQDEQAHEEMVARELAALERTNG